MEHAVRTIHTEGSASVEGSRSFSLPEGEKKEIQLFISDIPVNQAEILYIPSNPNVLDIALSKFTLSIIGKKVGTCELQIFVVDKLHPAISINPEENLPLNLSIEITEKGE